MSRPSPSPPGTAAELDLSIVVVNWNRAALTDDCLTAVRRHTTGVRYEILVVDNGSEAEEKARLEAVCAQHEASLIGLNQNLYFGEANNIGVEAARGRKVLLLNNDATVTPGYAPPLLDALEQGYAAGAVGPKFVFPDGRTQEVGAFVRTDGWTVQHGKATAPIQALAAGGLHIVDYCSAACVMLPRDLFLSHGGFDPLYDPAYFEDVDLMLRLRSAGRFTYLCSDVTVIHEENATSNSVWDQERRNRVVAGGHDRFFGRWGPYVERRLFDQIEPPRFPLIAWTPEPPEPPAGEDRKRTVLTGPGLIRDCPEWLEIIRRAGPLSAEGHVVFAAEEACSRCRVLTLAARAETTLGAFSIRRASALDPRA